MEGTHLNGDLSEVQQRVQMLSVFLLVGGIFLGNCMPEEPPRLCTLRPLLSCKFIEAPYPGGVNSKVGKS